MFITFEGGEGSGKSTQSKRLYEYLKANGFKAIHTREIGGTKEAEEIRNLLLYHQLYSVSEMMLVMAARYEHINKVIYPAMQDGYVVICDRFIDSTVCYQGGNNLTMEDIFQLHNKLIRSDDNRREIIMPDITFFMDLEPEVGLERSMRTKDINKFEQKEIKFHREVYSRFQRLANLYSSRIKVIRCANKGVEEIHQEVLELYNAKFNSS